MTDRSPSDIERDIEAERIALEKSIAALQAQFSPEALVRHAIDYMRENGMDIARSAGDTARKNPAAVALTGIGLAWLLSGAKGSDAKPPVDYDRRYTAPASGLASDGTPQMAGFDERVRASDRAMSGHEDTTANTEGDPTMTTQKSPAKDISEAFDDLKSSARSARDRVYRSAGELRERIDEGTADLSDEARQRVRQARAAAIAAQEQVEAAFGEAASGARDMARDNPLLVGALAFAAGAALGASLPRPSTENRSVGAYRDRLFDKAEHVYREEMARLRHVAETAVADSEQAVEDAISETGETAEGAVTRISGTLKSEARKHGAGS